jgi:predicted RNA methylase
MNPPFGAQYAARGADVRFLEKAVRIAPVGYSLHASITRRHLLRRLDGLGVSVAVEAQYEFPLPHQFRFHRKEKVLVEVDLLRYQRMG